jgi:hypothetical protein
MYKIIASVHNRPPFFPQVQNDHYEEFFAPELDKHGYNGLFKRKTTEVISILWSLVVLVLNFLY